MRRAARWAGAVRWYLRELTGESEYDRYCDRHRQLHPECPLPTRREYEVLRTHHRETHPQSRCC
ncbi:YbdD/YjiX family protein [Streptomyces sp. NPDC002888]|uniref:YbdD/YjiX family protein n=1 Tax=Streptomyces sp. NPDC002888 TaxID=3364668 RepID=UPI00368AC770